MPKDSILSRLVSNVRRSVSAATKKLGYDFWDEMMKNEIASSSKPEKTAVDWYRKEYAKNPDVWLKGGKLMKPGRLYLFTYKDPKFKKELEFYDTQPLVLCLGIFKTKTGDIRSIGINMHLLPPKVRRLVMFTIFTKFKTAFKKNLYAENQKDIPAIKWDSVAKPVLKYGAAFAFRMYIPGRMKHIVEFKVEDMPKAIWIPSAGYVRTNPLKLQRAWADFLKKYNRIAKLVGEAKHDSAV